MTSPGARPAGRLLFLLLAIAASRAWTGDADAAKAAVAAPLAWQARPNDGSGYWPDFSNTGYAHTPANASGLGLGAYPGQLTEFRKRMSDTQPLTVTYPDNSVIAFTHFLAQKGIIHGDNLTFVGYLFEGTSPNDNLVQVYADTAVTVRYTTFKPARLGVGLFVVRPMRTASGDWHPSGEQASGEPRAGGVRESSIHAAFSKPPPRKPAWMLGPESVLERTINKTTPLRECWIATVPRRRCRSPCSTICANAGGFAPSGPSRGVLRNCRPFAQTFARLWTGLGGLFGAQVRACPPRYLPERNSNQGDGT